MSNKPTFGSLFAGIGGFDMGMEQAGWECNFQVEWDGHCQSVLQRHWPQVPRWGDVSTVNGAEIPAVDCIIFGSPCQDLSTAGKQQGLTGNRSSLFFEAIRIIKEMRNATNGSFPKWSIWENVAGAMSSNKGADFGQVLDSLADAGAMVIEWKLLDSIYFNIPNADAECLLSLDTILLAEDQISPRYFLSVKALNGIISREQIKLSCSTDPTGNLMPSLLDIHQPSRRELLYALLMKHRGLEH